MNAPQKTPEHDRPERQQRRASAPDTSAWVTASAGTGKTKVLTDRVLRLLLTGAPASRLLCLTFTNAAAAEMSNRIAGRLADWATAPDGRLEAELARLQGRDPTPDECRDARRLFAGILDAPGGLAIATIHGFCQSLLRRFPLEAGIAPHFQVMDERDAAELMDEAREQVLAAAGADPALGAALARVIASAPGTDGFSGLLAGLSGERGRLDRQIGRHGGVEGVILELYRRLELRPDEQESALFAAACAETAFAGPDLRRAAAALSAGGVRDQERAGRMLPWLGEPARRAAFFEEWRRAFFTAKGEIYANLVSAPVAKAMPDAKGILEDEAERLIRVLDRLRTVRIAEATAALLRVGSAVLAGYAVRKRRRALLDYDDLVLAARNLLERDGGAAWALYKLDGGIDHVLIDEAQDTNPDQWAVVRALTAEFFSGRGRADEGTRTLFAVGDSKQSIYSFQRADPRAFAETRAELSKKVGDAHGSWVDVGLNTSFRSTRAVLDAVDSVFNGIAARDGVIDTGTNLVHLAARAGRAGRVELWPPVEPAQLDDIDPWEPPTRRIQGDSPSRRMARLLARRIARMVATESLESKGRPVRAGDILILVRRRGDFVGHLVRELKQAGVPVAGADRMVLTAQLAVADLMALGRVLLLPEDDLTLATVLKGPLVGLSEDELYTLAYDRPGTLWESLRAHAGRAPYEAAWDFLSGLLGKADLLPPHDLFAHILANGGKAKLLARLGEEAEDPLDEFITLALAHERLHAPSLQGFLHWLAMGGDEIKRDFEGGGDAVRIMTVHGAKGLQAPIVFLPDTLQMSQRLPALHWWGPRGDEMPLWVPYSDESDRIAQGARLEAGAAGEREYRRLLYVAMTRAEDRLIVCGWKNRTQSPPGSWYFLVRDALDSHPLTRREEDPFLTEMAETAGFELWSLSCPQEVAADPDAHRAEAELAVTLPDWIRLPVPLEESPPRPLAPSRDEGEEPPVRSPLAGGDEHRFRRGLLIHRLLQSVPDLPEADRAAATERFLERRLPDPAARAEIAAEVAAVLTDPVFSALFGGESRAEVPLTGLMGARAFSGQVDRLLVTESEVLVVDYKSNRPAPRTPDKVPTLYRRQMAAYRALLAAIYPGRLIRCGLLWTDGPRLMELPAAMLDEAEHALRAGHEPAPLTDAAP